MNEGTATPPDPGRHPGAERHWFRVGMLGLAMLAGVLIWRGVDGWMPVGTAPQTGWAQHIIRADVLVQDMRSDMSAPLPDAVPLSGPAGNWQPATLPHVSVGRQTSLPADAKGTMLTSWYRLQPGLLPAMQAQDDFYLYLPRWQTVGRVAVYADGRIVWRSSGDIVWNGFNRPLWIRLPQIPRGSLPVMLLRMDSIPGLGGGITSAWVGTKDALIWRYRMRFFVQDTLPAILAVAMLTLGLFVLAVWAVRPADPLYPLFVMVAFLFAGRSIQYYWVLDPALIPSAWFGWMTVNTMGWLVAVGLLFNCRLIALRLPIIERFFIGSMVACTILTMPLWRSSAQITALSTYAYLLCFVIAVPTLPLVTRAAWCAQSRAGLMLAAWNMALFPVAVHDLALANYKISLADVYLLPYTEIGLSLSCMYVVCRRYLDALSAVERLNASLEDRLHAREAELRTIYERLWKSEHQELLANERQRLMRDLHDGLGSSLVSAIRVVEHTAVAEYDSVVMTLRECLDSLKLTLDSLEPIEADLLLILASFRYRIEPRLQASGFTLEWAVTPLPPLNWLTPNSALHVLRIFQEVITNIVKHSGATHIRFSTGPDIAGAMVHVTDNGSGFIPTAEHEQSNGRGLKNIRWRAAALSGQAMWEAGAQGTTFTLWLPVRFSDAGKALSSP